MNNNQNILIQVQRQEEILTFSNFSYLDALKIGLLLIEKATEQDKPIAIEININQLTVFSHQMDGTTALNQDWIRRKKNLTLLTQKSSYYSHLLLQAKGDSLKDNWVRDTVNFGAFGGAFPIRLKNGLIIGCIAISGYPHAQDHSAIVEILNNYIGTNDMQ